MMDELHAGLPPQSPQLLLLGCRGVQPIQARHSTAPNLVPSDTAWLSMFLSSAGSPKLVEAVVLSLLAL